MKDVTKTRWLMLIAIICVMLTSLVENAKASSLTSRDVRAEEACVIAFNNSLKRMNNKAYIVESTMLGEVKPYVWVLDYKTDTGFEIQGYCAINISAGIIVPAFTTVTEAVNFIGK